MHLICLIKKKHVEKILLQIAKMKQRGDLKGDIPENLLKDIKSWFDTNKYADGLYMLKVKTNIQSESLPIVITKRQL